MIDSTKATKVIIGVIGIGYAFFERLFSKKTADGIRKEFLKYVTLKDNSNLFSQIPKSKLNKDKNWILSIEDYFTNKDIRKEDEAIMVFLN